MNLRSKTLNVHLTKAFVLQGRTGPASTTPLYRIRARPMLTQRFYKVAFVEAAIIYYALLFLFWYYLL
jgi:hypothetical protein